jgi:hypothetical protein
MAKNHNSSTIADTVMDRVLERCLKSIETKTSDGSRLFFPNGIELIRVAAKASTAAPSFDFEITIAGAAAPKPLSEMRFLLAWGKVQQACEDLFASNSDDCNKFVKAVAANFGIPLVGNADAIVSTIQAMPWNYIGNDLAAAKTASDFASQGKLVVAGLTASELGDSHGHVVVVVPGVLVNGLYPHAYWGSISAGKAARDQGVNFAFQHPFCDQVKYGWVQT